MPQLDIVTYNFINTSLMLIFWTYFAIMYLAVSYSMQKVTVGVFFKFITTVSTLITVISIRNVSFTSLEISNSCNYNN